MAGSVYAKCKFTRAKNHTLQDCYYRREGAPRVDIPGGDGEISPPPPQPCGADKVVTLD